MAKKSIGKSNDKSEAEIKAYGIHWTKKVKVRGISPHEARLLEEKREEKKHKTRVKRFQNFMDKSISSILKAGD